MIRGFLVGLICLVTTPAEGLRGHADAPVAARVDPPPGRELAPRPKPAPPPRPPFAPFAGLPTGGGDEGGKCSGTVTAVDEGSITVASGAQKLTAYTATGEFMKTIAIPAGPPRKFTAVGPLAEGGYLKDGFPNAQYRLSDVRVGDKVFFDWRRVGKVYEVHYVSIYRRPGGRVPRSPGEPPGEEHPWHERANAYQDLEEKGIPLPAKVCVPPPTPTLPNMPPINPPSPPRIPPAKP